MGRFRSVIAALVALALLVLPGTPMRHASAAIVAQQQASEGQAALDHCAGHNELAPAHVAASSHHHQGHGQPCHDSGGKLRLACCPAAQCPALVGAPPPATAGPLPMPGLTVRVAVLADSAYGIDIAPTTPPPRGT